MGQRSMICLHLLKKDCAFESAINPFFIFSVYRIWKANGWYNGIVRKEKGGDAGCLAKLLLMFSD
ncbi:hypothetical protein B6A27_13780 [Anoxybacillus sp. UARK-01]|nr:hypothetical protein B6A27_13780 [Anoxybacillus sp. UARK-01]